MYILRYFERDETTDMVVSASVKRLRERAITDGFRVLDDDPDSDVISVYKDDTEVGVIGKVQVG